MPTLHLPRKTTHTATKKTFTAKTQGANMNTRVSVGPRPAPTLTELDELLAMMTYARAHGSTGEAGFVERFVRPLPGIWSIDDWAWATTIHHPDGAPSPTLFSCHVDTVHSDGADPRQQVDHDRELGIATSAGAHVLGADDAAGVWLMRQMIGAQIPGTYVFHRCEERGGKGSEHLAHKHFTWLEGFSRAIAFDRRGTSDIITHQGWGRCCSELFANALSAALNEHGELTYAPSSGGVFTDTANYVDIIGECTNVSVGYLHEHTEREMLDTEHLFALRDALLLVQWDALPTERGPGDDDGRLGTNLSFSFEADASWGMDTSSHTVADLYDMDEDDMHEFIRHNPDAATSLMWELLWGDERAAALYSMDE